MHGLETDSHCAKPRLIITIDNLRVAIASYIK